jgi:hypothetical protein
VRPCAGSARGAEGKAAGIEQGPRQGSRRALPLRNGGLRGLTAGPPRPLPVVPTRQGWRPPHCFRFRFRCPMRRPAPAVAAPQRARHCCREGPSAAALARAAVSVNRGRSSGEAAKRRLGKPRAEPPSYSRPATAGCVIYVANPPLQRAAILLSALAQAPRPLQIDYGDARTPSVRFESEHGINYSCANSRNGKPRVCQAHR